MSECLWRLEGVTVQGRGRFRLEIDRLEVKHGVTAIVGPSGAGKTTLLDLLVGFQRPDGGELTLCIPPGQRLPLYWVPADDGLWPHLTVREHVRVAAGGGGTARVDRLLERFELADKCGDSIDQLSSGERARLSVARALATGARVLVMDEPLAHVDVSGGLRFWNVVRDELARDEQASLVFSTHIPEIALGQANQVICIEAGRVVWVGEGKDLYLAPPNARAAAFLGPGNWFQAAENAAWFDPPGRGDRCVRPEQLAMTARDDGPLVVERARFAGPISHVEVRDPQCGASRTLYLQRAASGWRGGERVWLSILGMLLCLALAGCTAPGAVPELKARAIDEWILPPEDIRVPSPRALHCAGEEIYCLDNAGRVLVYNQQGQLQRQWWMPEYSVGRPEKIWRLKDGRLIVADTHYHRVMIFDEAGKELARLGGFGKEPGQFVFPVALVQDEREFIYVCEYGENDRVQKFTPDGRFVLQFGGVGTEPGKFQRPSGIAWHKGLLYVVDAFNNRIQVFDEEGTFIKTIPGAGEPGSLYYPYDIAVGPDGLLYVVEYGAGRVARFDVQGRLLGCFGSTGQGDGQFQTPWGLTVDAAGAVYVADTGNRRIVKLAF